MQAKDRGNVKGVEGGRAIGGGSITLWEAENEGEQHSTSFGSEPCLCH